MRLLTTINPLKDGEAFAAHLKREGINSLLEVTKGKDWGDDTYGLDVANVWIVDEDDVPRALEFLEMFNQDRAQFEQLGQLSLQAQQGQQGQLRLEEHGQSPLPPPEHPFFSSEGSPVKDLPPSPLMMQQTLPSPITTYVFAVCVLLYFWGLFYEHQSPPGIANAFQSPVHQELLYDYPEAFQILNKMIALYTPEELKNPGNLPPEGQYLYVKFINTPYWKGYYERLLNRIRDPNDLMPSEAPMFEKIKKGEVWRTFTPALLHHDFLHLFFNMAWLLILGRQMEQRLPAMRYLLFMLICGILSNTAQYLMSGAQFLGYSGVLAGMIVFVWFRRKNAPWEGYQLHRSTMIWIVAFVLIMVGIQVGAFVSEALLNIPFSVGIANTAHLSGGLVGYLFSKLDFFSRKVKRA
jgi:GlpG protein